MLLVRGADVGGEEGRLADFNLAGPFGLSEDPGGWAELLLVSRLVLGRMGEMGVSVTSTSGRPCGTMTFEGMGGAFSGGAW